MSTSAQELEQDADKSTTFLSIADSADIAGAVGAFLGLSCLINFITTCKTVSEAFSDPRLWYGPEHFCVRAGDVILFYKSIRSYEALVTEVTQDIYYQNIHCLPGSNDWDGSPLKDHLEELQVYYFEASLPI